METVKQRRATTVKAIVNLKEALDDFALLVKSENYTQKAYRKERDSLVKRFELAVDTLWKYLKFYIQEKSGIVHNSPKEVFRECARARLLDESEAFLALKMVDARNEATHIYREVIAEELAQVIPVYYMLMDKLITLTDAQLTNKIV